MLALPPALIDTRLDRLARQPRRNVVDVKVGCLSARHHADTKWAVGQTGHGGLAHSRTEILRGCFRWFANIVGFRTLFVRCWGFAGSLVAGAPNLNPNASNHCVANSRYLAVNVALSITGSTIAIRRRRACHSSRAWPVISVAVRVETNRDAADFVRLAVAIGQS